MGRAKHGLIQSGCFDVQAHSKKCVELGIFPVPTSAEDNQDDKGEVNLAGDSDTDDDGDADDLRRVAKQLHCITKAKYIWFFHMELF